VAVVDVLPGEPPVRVSHTWAQSPADPLTGEAEAFTGLTPRVAALLVVSYTRPGDVIIDTTADLAVEGTATAGARQYHRRAAIPDLTSGRERSPSGARLVVLRWPTEPSPGAGCDATRQFPAGADLEATLIAGRRVAALDAHLVVVSGPSGSSGYRDRARRLIQALRATGGGRLREVVLVGHDPSDDASGKLPDGAAPRPDRIVFVVSLRVGGRHD
jgi:hypothetical protein